MISKVTEHVANGSAPRILARQLARPLTEDEINHISGGMISHGAVAGALATRRADTCSGTGCPENDSDA
jgi:hypothetical protein